MANDGSAPLKLKVFQASPLAYGDIPIPFMDLDEEEAVLKEALEGSNIDVTFEIATVTAFSTFLAQGNSFLHLSCHGHPNQLFIEDGYGGCHILIVGDTLTQWISAGGQRLQFVFVSACHSRSVGEAFIDAGVPYVICCEQDGHQLLDQAARIFARSFYMAVANGLALQESYEMARSTVIQSPEIQQVAGINPEKEAKKFILLRNNKVGEDIDQEDTTTTNNNNETSREEDHQKGTTTTDNIGNNENAPILKVLRNPMQGTDSKELKTLSLSESFDFRRHSAYLSRKTRKEAMDSMLEPNDASNLSMSMLRIPVPPKPFLERERVMHGILRNLFKDRQTMRLIRVAGEKGIGKVSLAKAIAHYVKKRNMWGHVLWLPIAGSMNKISPDSTFDSIRQVILEKYCKQKALLIIDTTQFSKHSMSSLCSFLDDVFEVALYVKVIVIHNDNVVIKSRKSITGFPEASLSLEPLSFEGSAFLFCHSCQYVHKWFDTMAGLLQKESDANTWLVLGKGNPARILLLAKTITKDEFKKLTRKDSYPTLIEDFKKRLEEVNEKMRAVDKRNQAHFRTAPEAMQMVLKNMLIKDLSKKSSKLTLRTQEEIIDRFVPILKKERIYRKMVRSFVRKASKGERIATIINGVTSTEKIVEDESSWVVCGQVANELYPLPSEKFEKIYDTQHPEDLSQTHPFYHQNGFKGYRSRRKIFAHRVDESDMNFFRHGSAAAAITEEAYFMAPWGTPTRVELGDFLALQYPDGLDDIYRIERTLFEGSYTDIQRASIEQSGDLRAHTDTLQTRMAQYCKQNPTFAALNGDICLHFRELLAALDQAEQKPKSGME